MWRGSLRTAAQQQHDHRRRHANLSAGGTTAEQERVRDDSTQRRHERTAEGTHARDCTALRCGENARGLAARDNETLHALHILLDDAYCRKQWIAVVSNNPWTGSLLSAYSTIAAYAPCVLLLVRAFCSFFLGWRLVCLGSACVSDQRGTPTKHTRHTQKSDRSDRFNRTQLRSHRARGFTAIRVRQGHDRAESKGQSNSIDCRGSEACSVVLRSWSECAVCDPLARVLCAELSVSPLFPSLSALSAQSSAER